MSREVWVMETGEYEQRFVYGVYSSPDIAEDVLRETYSAPYIVTWQTETSPADIFDMTFIGQFEAVPGYSTQHRARFDLTRYVVDERETE